MLTSLSGRLAALLTTLFAVIAALLMAMSQRMPELHGVIEIGAWLLAAAIGFALLAALLVFNLLTRRLHTLAQAIDSFRDNHFTAPGRLPWARADGDEIDRLAQAFGDLAERISGQIDELRRHDVQRRELLANVSHDLRTPLTLMQGYLQTLLLRHGELGGAEQRDCLEIATRHAERLARLVADLFELAKLDGPAPGLASEAFSLTELAQDVAQKFALHAAGRGVMIHARLAPGAAVVRGDIGLVERALENLVENALRHTGAGGSVRLEVAAAGERVRVAVCDTGCGIAHESLPHVFDRYFQAPRVEAGAASPCGDARPPAGHHAGLGLAITKRIVALHDGAIHVDSTLGVGTVFSIELPAAPRAGTATGTEEPACHAHPPCCCPP